MIGRGLVGFAAVLLISAGAGAGTLETIKERGEIRLGFRTDAAPFSYRDAKGAAAGYSVDLCALVVGGISRRLKLKTLAVKLVPVSTGDRFKAIEDGRIDLLCGATTVTLSRRQRVDFSQLIYFSGASVMMRADGPAGFVGLNGKSIGVRGATTTEKLLRAVLAQARMTSKVVAMKDHREGLKQLEGGQIDAYFADRSLLVGLLDQSAAPGKLKVATQLLSREPYALAMRRGDSDFRLAVDRALSRIYHSPAIVRVYKRNFRGRLPSKTMATLYLFNGLPE
jgi:polar amino acid transport system substrate-binding protein/glutamate/aspartate transport system substrate-binding protein